MGLAAATGGTDILAPTAISLLFYYGSLSHRAAGVESTPHHTQTGARWKNTTKKINSTGDKRIRHHNDILELYQDSVCFRFCSVEMALEEKRQCGNINEPVLVCLKR